jgi:FkbM family methyltransferase
MNHCANVTILPVAISDENGTALFDDDTDASQGHLSANGRLEVTIARLDDVAKVEKLPPPDVIKMDVEGAEAKVFAGGERIISQSRPLIFLATHGAEVKQECLRWLRGHGYNVESLLGSDAEYADEFIAQVRG